MTQLLLVHGANPNIQHSRTGATPAHRAARNGSLETLTALLHGGAHIHLSDRRGRLPMDLASNNMVNDLQSKVPRAQLFFIYYNYYKCFLYF
uniref:Uncharacterized protein n=1 Tax=Pyxicephalus adspersus TaxID=30357 RepID=A0AAV3AT17_PYXAD|nr:TPA: hypothetical protein GDO54_008548 [Pyxicephalus adspersus]